MKSKVIVLTGASSGIGAALVERLGQEPKGTFKLALLSRRQEVLDSVAAASFHKGDCSIVKSFACDVTNEGAVHNVAAEVINTWGTIDVWINNAGRGLVAKVSELKVEEINDMMNVNVHSALYGMQAVLPHMKEKAHFQQEEEKKKKKTSAATTAAGGEKEKKLVEDGGGGSDISSSVVVGQIINVSSVLGRNAALAPQGMRSAYSGAKHFLNALVDSLAAELESEFCPPPQQEGEKKKKEGGEDAPARVCPIVLTTISPGMVATDFGTNAGGLDSKANATAQPVAEVANVIFGAITEPRGYPVCSEYYTRAEHKQVIDNHVTTKGSDQKCLYTGLVADSTQEEKKK